MRRKIHRYDAILILGVELGRQDEPTPELRRRIAEAAQALRISQSAVKQRLQRANRRLRDRLKEWYYDA